MGVSLVLSLDWQEKSADMYLHLGEGQKVIRAGSSHGINRINQTQARSFWPSYTNASLAARQYRMV
jgi:hypothetical protein